MTHKTRQGSARRLALLVALLFQGISGFGGGVALVADPSGGLLRLPLYWLAGSPFASYLIPGLVLLVLLGLLPLVVAVGLWRQASWAHPGAILIGLALIIWLAVEILVVGFHLRPPLQLIYGALAVLILGLALIPTIRRTHPAVPDQGRPRPPQ